MVQRKQQQQEKSVVFDAERFESNRTNKTSMSVFTHPLTHTENADCEEPAKSENGITLANSKTDGRRLPTQQKEMR